MFFGRQIFILFYSYYCYFTPNPALLGDASNNHDCSGARSTSKSARAKIIRMSHSIVDYDAALESACGDVSFLVS